MSRPDQDDLWAAVDSDLRAEGVRRRWLVATGGICPCGSRVLSWLWTDRIAGVPEPAHRIVGHLPDCPAMAVEGMTG